VSEIQIILENKIRGKKKRIRNEEEDPRKFPPFQIQLKKREKKKTEYFVRENKHWDIFYGILRPNSPNQQLGRLLSV